MRRKRRCPPWRRGRGRFPAFRDPSSTSSPQRLLPRPRRPMLVRVVLLLLFATAAAAPWWRRNGVLLGAVGVDAGGTCAFLPPQTVRCWRSSSFLRQRADITRRPTGRRGRRPAPGGIRETRTSLPSARSAFPSSSSSAAATAAAAPSVLLGGGGGAYDNEGAAALTAAETATEIDARDGAGSPTPPRHEEILLDRFAAALRESLTNNEDAAAQQQHGGGGRQQQTLSSSLSAGAGAPVREEEGAGSSISISSSSSEDDPTLLPPAAADPCAFRSLTVDLVAAARRGGPADSSGGPPPRPGSVKKVIGRLVRLATTTSASSSARRRPRRTRPANNYNNNNDDDDMPPRLVLQVTYKYHGATDIVKNYPVGSASDSLRELLGWLLMRMTASAAEGSPKEEYDKSAGTDVPAAVASVATEWGVDNLVPTQLVTMRGALDTTAGRHVLTIPHPQASSSMPSGKTRQQQQRSSLRHFPATAGSATAAAIRDEHDRPRNRRFSVEDDFWKSVGVTTTSATAAGAVAVRPDMAAKVRQCEKFVEIVANLLKDATTTAARSSGGSAAASLPTPVPAVRITDLGCGKGYLTYALHSYLQKQQQRQDGDGSDQALCSSVTSIGVDIRPKLVRELNQIVTDLRIEGLRFEQGSIQDACLGDAREAPGEPGTSNDSGAAVQVFIALHACDTATDDALFSAIQRGADVIVTAPCCHKQLRPQINALLLVGDRTSKELPHPLADVLRHGIYRERTSETVTDALRALLLELAGYKTSVFEFVGGEHTAKNCMITGVRRAKRSSSVDAEAIRNRIRSLAEFYGVRNHKLAAWMGEQSLMAPSGRDSDDDDTASSPPARRSIRSMPPL